MLELEPLGKGILMDHFRHVDGDARTSMLWPCRPLVVAALAALPGIMVLSMSEAFQGSTFVDDAYIFYRYAANWAAGDGPVFNPGEYVEGYSSLLWTSMLAFCDRLGIRPDIAGPALGVFLGIIGLALAAHLARKVFPNSPWLWVAVPLAWSLGSGFSYFAASGMETTLFAVILLGVVVAARDFAFEGEWYPLAAFLAWLKQKRFILADPTRPAAAAIERLCSCPEVVLDVPLAQRLIGEPIRVP